MDGDATGQPCVPDIDPHQRHEHQDGFHIVAEVMRVDDQAGQLRKREDEHQVEEQLYVADPLNT